MLKLKNIFRTNHEAVGSVLVTIPILTYWTYWMLNPSYWFNADPAAVYFLDSLAIFSGKSYVFVDHPGTPVQVIGTFLLAIFYPFFESREAFIQFFLNNPEIFFAATNVFLLLSNLFCVVIFYKLVASSLINTKFFAAVSIALLFFALHPDSYESLTFWSHNSLNFPFGTLILVWLYREMKPSQEIKPVRLVLLGFATGILSVAQLYFFAWLVAGVLTVTIFSIRMNVSLASGLRTGMYMFLGGVFGVISMLIPVYDELPRFIHWTTRVATHLGLYGNGESGFFSGSLILSAIAFWWEKLQAMSIILVSSVITLFTYFFWSKNKQLVIPDSIFAMSTGLLLQILLLLLFVIKATTKLRYSLSLASVLPLLVFILIVMVENTTWKLKKMLPLFYILILAGVTTQLISQKEPLDRRIFQEQDAQTAIVEAKNRFLEKSGKREVAIVYAYAVPSKCAGLLQSNNWTGHFTNELEKICPNQFSIWDADVVLNEPIPVKSIVDIDWDIVVWPGNGTNLPEYLHSIGATNIPVSWHVSRSKWFFIHSEVLDQ